MGEVIYLGGEMDSVEVRSGTPVEVAGVGTAYTRAAIKCATGSVIRLNFYDLPSSAPMTVDAGETLFVHYQRNTSGAVSTIDHLLTTILDNAGLPWVAIINSGGTGNAIGIYGNTGSGGAPVWSLIGAVNGFAPSTAYVDDIRVRIGLAGVHTVEWAINQTRVALGTFTNAAFTNAASVDLTGLPFGADIFYSEMACTQGLSTVGAHVQTSALSGAGATSGWTGAYTDANEIVLNDSTSLSVATAGQTSTFACADVTTPPNYYMPCVFVWTRGKNSGASPENIQTVFRIGGVDYASANLANTGVAFTNQPTRYDQAPSGVDWTDAVFNPAERGVRSAA